ncbi:MAG: GAF domain-containing sensor histidine kinase [Brevefilum sp.]|nr:GAF domain-containing sensor histidine kinase [Brevefilum sp.]MDT8381983.1 GAF domain-containing sensor histidine kinase [Brevefilum sp.]MDW7754488.1 GAF domain-containing sensor histidine kinase [Brevefilum sp.]
MNAADTLSCEQLEERLAALHQASLELVQDISIDSLLQKIARIAIEQAGAKFAAIGVRGDNGGKERFITVGMAGDRIENLPNEPRGLSMLDVIAESDGPIRVEYIQKDNKQAGLFTEEPQMTALLGVPIRLGERRLGQIYLTDKAAEKAFTPDDEQVIETLASYAAVAISNARSYNALRERDRALTRRNQDLALLNNLASALASITEQDELLITALDRVMNYFNLNTGEIYLKEEDQNSLQNVIHRGESIKRIWSMDRFTLGESLIGKTAQNGQPILVNLPFEEDQYLNNQSLVENKIKQIACFPLTSRSEVLGVISIATHQEQELDDMDQQLLSSIASWVGTTLENVRLNIQGRRLAVLEERERIGMDLHDGVIQSIYAVGLTLEHARLLLGEEPEQTRKRINQSIEDLNSTIRDLRAFIMDMRPRQLYEENLMEGLQRLVNEFQANSLVETTLNGPSDGLENLPDAHAIALFHICQEALANIAKHAQASKVEVLVWTTTDRVLMEVHDDGRGFDPGQVRVTLGHGISNMQTRARNVGGDLEITTEPGEGTTIMAWMPYTAENQKKGLD